jgi:hypothetical protein
MFLCGFELLNCFDHEGTKGSARASVLARHSRFGPVERNLLDMNDNGASEVLRRAAPFVSFVPSW